MQDSKDNQELGKVLPFEKPIKKPRFKSISLEELKDRMKKQGFQPFDKAEFKKQVSKQHNPGNQRTELDSNLLQNIRELQEVCRILSQNLRMVHQETEQRVTDVEGRLTWIEEQLLELSSVVQRMAMYLEKRTPPN